MKAIVWSKDSCSYCEQAKSLLKLKNIDKLVDIIDSIVLEIDVNYVKFHDFFENLLEYSKNDENS